MTNLNAFSTIIRPVVSEKGTVLGDQGKYVFEVAPQANKIQIKHAVEEAFANKKVQVSAVNILNVTGQTRRRQQSPYRDGRHRVRSGGHRGRPGRHRILGLEGHAVNVYHRQTRLCIRGFAAVRVSARQ